MPTAPCTSPRPTDTYSRSGAERKRLGHFVANEVALECTRCWPALRVPPQGLELDNRDITNDQEDEEDGWDQVFPGRSIVLHSQEVAACRGKTWGFCGGQRRNATQRRSPPRGEAASRQRAPTRALIFARDGWQVSTGLAAGGQVLQAPAAGASRPNSAPTAPTCRLPVGVIELRPANSTRHARNPRSVGTSNGPGGVSAGDQQRVARRGDTQLPGCAEEGGTP